MSKIATVKLAPGNVGFYDNLTRIHLTLSSPKAEVFEGMNTTNLRKGVRYKTIEVIEGSLVPVVDPDGGVDEKISAAKTECKSYTDTKTGEIKTQTLSEVDEKINAAKEEVKQDSKTKADTAKTEAIAEAEKKSNTAKTHAVQESKAYTDQKVQEAKQSAAQEMSLDEEDTEEKVVKRGRPKKPSSTEEEA